MSSLDLSTALERIAAEQAAQTGRLDLSGLRITELPPELQSLSSLQSLNCSETQVSDLSPLQGLSSLQRLDCTSTRVSDLSPLQGLSSLHSLGCGNTGLSDLTPLKDLSNLQLLSCDMTGVSDLTPLKDLTSLVILGCSLTRVSDLSPLRDLSNLYVLQCPHTCVCALTPLQGLTSLVELNCSHTPVSDLTPLMGLTSLQSLNCSGTLVSDLTPLQGLTSLLSLDCSSTGERSLRRSFPNLPHLDPKTLKIFLGNRVKINEFPIKILFSPTLEKLNLNNSDILGIPEEVISSDDDNNCLASLRAHVRDLEDEAIPLHTVKILVLGNGGVGKTQLCRHLAAEPFDPSVRSTHGITVRTLTPSSEADPTKYLWDFGGQDIYHAAHTLFMRTAAVFVVLWTPEQEAQVGSDDDDPLLRRHPLTYWLEYVRALGRRDSPVVVVQSQCDQPDQDEPVLPVDPVLLKSFNCLRHFSFSARTSRGAATLKEALQDASDYLRQRDGISTIGRGRFQVWQQLENWRQEDQQLPAEQRQHRTLSQQEFGRLCDRTGGVSSAEALLQYLHNTGVVFHSPKLFHDRIILDQSWALDAVYAVFERNSTYQLIKGDDGLFSPSLLAATVWQEYDPDAQKLFLSLMLTCGIMFPYREADAAAGLEARYLAPDLLPPRSSPQVNVQLQGRWDGSDPALMLTYRYPFLHSGLVRALLCDLGNHAADAGVYWRYGAWVYDARGGNIAMLQQRMVDDRAGEITIRMHGADTSELARWFEERMAERNRQFGYADLKPISSGPLASQVRSIGKRQRLDPAEGSGTPPVLAPQLVPAPVEAFDKPHREVFISYAWGDDSDVGKERQRIVDELVKALRNHHEEITVRIDRDEMHPGQLISAFMDRLAAADRVIVVISDKYLRSEYCMYELFMLYQNCSKNADRFHRCIIPIILPDARLTEGLASRLKRAIYWNNQDAVLQSMLAANLPAVGSNAYSKCRLIGEFARNTSDMLEYLMDQLQPRDYDRQVAEGFTELCEQLLAD